MQIELLYQIKYAKISCKKPWKEQGCSAAHKLCSEKNCKPKSVDFFFLYTKWTKKKWTVNLPVYSYFPLLFQTVHVNLTGEPESLIHDQKNDYKELFYHLYK